MTYDDALRTLGLDPGASPDEREVRQAYVRLVKVHKPERDPQRFQAIREAYELARRGRPRSFVSLLHSHAANVEAPNVEAPNVDAPNVEAPNVDAPNVDAPNVDTPDVDAPNDDGPDDDAPDAPPTRLFAPLERGPVDPAIQRVYDALDEALDDDARLAVLVRAVKEHPREAELRWELYDLYRFTNEHAAARRTLEEGVALDLPHFLEEFAHAHPAEVSPAQRARLLEAGARLLALRVLVVRGDREGAEAELAALLAHAEATAHARIPRGELLRVGLSAMGRGDRAFAERVVQAVRDRPELFGPAVGAQVIELHLRELLDAAPHLEPDVCKCIALELDASPRGAHPLAALQAGDPRGAARALRTLGKHAPTLAQTLAPLLGDRARFAPPPAPTEGVPWRMIFMLLLGAFQMMRLCNLSAPTHPSYDFTPLPPPTVDLRARELVVEPTPPFVSSVADDPSPLSTTVERICVDAPSHCAAARRVSSRTLADDCAEGRREAERLEEDCGLSDARDLCRELTLLVVSRCMARETLTSPTEGAQR